MNLSIRNQLDGTVTSVVSGEAMSTVKVSLTSGQQITTAITAEASRDLGLAEGTAVKALIKATDVALASGELSGISIRNRIPGTVRSVQHGAAMTTVKVELAGGVVLTSAITNDGAEDLPISEGTAVTALVKSTEIGLALA